MMMKLTSFWCLRMALVMVTLILFLGASNLFAQGRTSEAREYGLKNPYPREQSPEQHSSGSMTAFTRSTDTRVERALQQAESARSASPPRYQEAADAFRFAAFYDPKEVRAYFGLGYVYFVQGRYAEAAEAYKKAMAAQPSLPEGHYDLGVTYVHLNEKQKALSEARILERLKSKFAVRLSELATR